MNNSKFRLDGKVALITGASRGIGQSIAETFAENGAKLSISSRKQEGIDEVRGKIMKAGGEVLAISAHTGNNNAIIKLVEKTLEVYGKIDILVNNAATNPHFGPILSADEGQWTKILDTNLIGYFRMIKACVPIMQELGYGKIINIASIAGKSPQTGMGIYSISKAGVIMLTEVLAAELSRDNIQVNAIAPGFVKTRFSQALWDNPNLNELIINRIPQHRMATPEEITGMALFLASDESSYVTGSTFVIDGGQMVNSGSLP